MLDETILLETPPLYSCYGRVGQQVHVPVTGNRARRVLHGVLNVARGAVLLLITNDWDHHTPQAFLRRIRAHWRGWRIVLFEERGSPHTAADSQEGAQELGLELRWLPTATPKLNAMDHLWRQVKGPALANRSLQSVDDAADTICQDIFALEPQDRLRKAGILSGNFWLTY